MADAYIVKKGKVIATYKDYQGMTALPLVGGAEQLGFIISDTVNIATVVDPTSKIATLTITGVFADESVAVVTPK